MKSCDQLANQEMTPEILKAMSQAGETARKILKTQLDFMVEKKKWNLD